MKNSTSGSSLSVLEDFAPTVKVVGQGILLFCPTAYFAYNPVKKPVHLNPIMFQGSLILIVTRLIIYTLIIGLNASLLRELVSFCLENRRKNFETFSGFLMNARTIFGLKTAKS